MAMEKPVVATNIDAHRNLIKNGITGILTNCYEDDFKRGIIDLLNDPNLAHEIGKKGRRFVEKKYSNEIIGHKYKDFLIQLLKSKK